jgi:hypothetical protein
MFFVS